MEAVVKRENAKDLPEAYHEDPELILRALTRLAEQEKVWQHLKPHTP